MTETEANKNGARSGRIVRLAGALLVIAAFIFLARLAGDQLPRAIEWVEGLGFWGPIAFILMYAVGVVFLVPGAVLTLAGGALFGVAFGTAWVFLAAVLGSGAAFLVARYVARSTVERRLEAFPRFAAVDRAVGEEGLRMVFLLRLSPVFPFSVLNYALGLTRVGFRDYMLASVGMLPGTLLYVYYGRLIGDVAQLAGGVQQQRGLGDWLVLGLGLVATVAVTWFVTRAARSALADLEDGDDTDNGSTAGGSDPDAPGPANTPASSTAEAPTPLQEPTR